MSPEKQRIAIAEACGWIRLSRGMLPSGRAHPLLSQVDWEGTPPGDAHLPEDDQGLARIPDYLNDLNAMHEAEKEALTDGFWAIYGGWLEGVTKTQVSVGSGDPEGRTEYRELATCCAATAAQRAEAFLRTLGKWEDA